jgi:hypothetical protein
MLNSLLILSCVLGQSAPFDVTKYTPFYHKLNDHPWNAVHKAFFVRTFTTGETYYHHLSFDVPWSAFQRLSTQDSEYHHLLKQFEAIDQLPRKEMENASPIRRLLFFRDLWTVFEKLQHMASKDRGKELRRRVARIMKRLELTDDDIERIPNTLAMIRAKAAFPESPDPEHPEKPFLPTALLREDSEWMAISASKNIALGAPTHTESVNQRSLFSIHMHYPDGRKAGEQFIAASRRQDTIQFPPGTELALMRRAVAVNKNGKLNVTNLVESLQLLVSPVAEAQQDARFKFVLDRSECLSGEPGLQVLESNSPIDAYGIESAGQWKTPQKEDADGEPLVLGRGKGHVGVPSMQHCVACHGFRNTRFNANFRQFPVYVTTNLDLARALESSKENSDSWRDYLQLRKTP